MPTRPPLHRPIARGPGRRPEKELPGQRLYDHQWRATRARFLAENPFCVGPGDDGRGCDAAATDVDHITPHRGDPALFNDWKNLQALCKACHSRKTRREGGRTYG